MEVHAITRNVRMSAQKMREVVRQIQGLPAQQAVSILAVVPRKSARLVAKTLKSAIANAENNHSLKPETLRVKEAVAGTASTMKRFTPKARGRRTNPEAKLSYHDHPLGQLILWDRRQIQSAFESPSIRIGVPNGAPRKRLRQVFRGPQDP